ncbi:MAG: MBL fold metallo-hydrolase [Candidatus Rokubacteria bacterium]|nr:MBL fold metallo-hydrolase [Candidatus Rokubacteria bacterium]
MTRQLARVIAVLGLVAVVGGLGGASTLQADQDRDRDRENERPPQTLKSGFESTDRLLRDVERAEDAPLYSAWIVESSRFLNVPYGAFMPDRVFIPGSTNPRNNIPSIDLPVNVGIIKGPRGKITLYDAGWKQLAYIFDWNTSCCWKGLRDQMTAIGLDPDDVTRIVIGHGHWDHAGQLSDFPNATLYVQKEELKQIDFFLDYPTAFNQGNIRAVNTINPLTGAQVGPPAQACARSPVCGYPPQTVQEILGKLLHGKAEIVDGRKEIAPGLVIHPAFRGHTYGSQLLQVNTRLGQLVFGSDTYSSWQAIRDWNVANIQQTDSIQQFLAYEKCYVLTSRTASGVNNCIAAHEPNSYTADYPITANWWNIPNGNCSRAAELVLAPREPSHVPANPDKRPPSQCVSVIPPHPIIP